MISNRIENSLKIDNDLKDTEPLWLQYFTKRLVVKDGTIRRMIPFTNILYLQSQSNYTLIVTTDKRFLVSKTLKHFEELLISLYFLRVHHSFIVNRHYIDSFSKVDQAITLTNGAKIPVTRNFKNIEVF